MPQHDIALKLDMHFLGVQYYTVRMTEGLRIWCIRYAFLYFFNCALKLLLQILTARQGDGLFPKLTAAAFAIKGPTLALQG